MIKNLRVGCVDRCVHRPQTVCLLVCGAFAESMHILPQTTIPSSIDNGQGTYQSSMGQRREAGGPSGGGGIGGAAGCWWWQVCEGAVMRVLRGCPTASS